MLTHIRIASAKPAPKPYNLADADGLFVTVQTNGSKLWRFRYRFVGRQKTLHLGQWPSVSLADARTRRDEARRNVAAGLDPAQLKKKARDVAKIAAANTFRAIAEEWYRKCEDEALAPITLRKIRWLLDIAYPTLATMPVTDITPPDCIAALRKLEGAGRRESARRMRSVLGRVFRYAIHTGRLKDNPAGDLRGAIAAPIVTHIAAITKAEEAGALMRRIEHYTGHAITVIALQVSPHVFVRPGELRRWAWEEINWEQAYWDIPEEKMKRRIPLRVPLSRQVQAKILQLWEITGGGKYLFPSFRSALRPMSENTINAALRALGYAQDEMTAHGFRSMADSLLNETGLFNPDAIERQLAHQDKNSVRRIYMRAEFWAERVRMMQFWSDYLEQLCDDLPPVRSSAAAQGTRPTFGPGPSSMAHLAHD
ncbi:tyrosine-type recombinase/integrase [Sphingomonas sp.]|uniref:tyrosine-type recombinase/integrase n=1 Tax=Sphingomonas sp. TaxID=28214 RepID=UPI002D1FABB2|nr:integrase arm-type DNA-binding domain-containing protein [Sphingomonas sp.]